MLRIALHDERKSLTSHYDDAKQSNLHLSGFVRKMSHSPSDGANRATSPQKANDNEGKIAREWDQRAMVYW
jgi:hypothetical protein